MDYPGSGAGALSSVTVTLTSSIEAEELSFSRDCPRRFIFSIISNFSFSSFSCTFFWYSLICYVN